MRWTELLHAADTAPTEGRRRPVMRVLRRQATTDNPISGAGEGGEADPGDEAGSRLHVCRTTRLPDPEDQARPLLRTVHRTGVSARAR